VTNITVSQQDKRLAPVAFHGIDERPSANREGYLVPERGIEPPTFSLRMSCSTD
jgi:hypothetical protein